MEFINKCARLSKESKNENVCNKEQIKEGESLENRIGISKPSELGRSINNIISKDIYENHEKKSIKDAPISTNDLYSLDFICNITDTTKLKEIFTHIETKKAPEFMSKLEPGCSYIYFMWKEKKSILHIKNNKYDKDKEQDENNKEYYDKLVSYNMSLERVVSYINNKCASVLPYPIDINKVVYIGQYNYKGSVGSPEILSYHIYVVADDRFFKTQMESDREKLEDVAEQIKNDFSKSSLQIKYDTGSNLKHNLCKIPRIKELKDNEKYIVTVTVENTLNTIQQTEIFNTLLKSIGQSRNKVIKNDIINLGVFRVGTISKDKYVKINILAVEVKE